MSSRRTSVWHWYLSLLFNKNFLWHPLYYHFWRRSRLGASSHSSVWPQWALQGETGPRIRMGLTRCSCRTSERQLIRFASTASSLVINYCQSPGWGGGRAAGSGWRLWMWRVPASQGGRRCPRLDVYFEGQQSRPGAPLPRSCAAPKGALRSHRRRWAGARERCSGASARRLADAGGPRRVSLDGTFFGPQPLRSVCVGGASRVLNASRRGEEGGGREGGEKTTTTTPSVYTTPRVP